MKKNGLVALVVLLLAAVPLMGGTAQTAFARAPTWVYDFFPLDVEGADATMVEGINNRNDIVGATHVRGSDVEPTVNEAFLLSGGTLSRFGVANAQATIPLDINDSGVIVGRCHGCGGGLGDGFLYLDGTFTIAPFNTGNTVRGETTGVNQQGHLVGWIDEEFVDPPFGTTRRRSSYINGQYFPHVQLTGVNDAGHVVSLWEIAADLSAGPFLHTHSTTTRITLPFRPDAGPEPQDVNNHDIVVGSYLHESTESGSAFRGFVWSNGKAVPVNYPGAFTTVVNAINDAGIIVGTYGTDAERALRHGFVAVPRSPVTMTVNGAAGPAMIDRTQPLRVDVAFQAPPDGPMNPAELYVGVIAPSGVFWLDASGRFGTTPMRLFAGALPSFGPSPAINLASASAFPAGSYTWFAIVDDDTDGAPNATFYDLAQVTIR